MLEQLKPNPKTIVFDLVADLTVSVVSLARVVGLCTPRPAPAPLTTMEWKRRRRMESVETGEWQR